MFQKISGSEKLWIREGGNQDLPSKIFRLTKPKIFVGESFSVLLFSGNENVWMRGVVVGGGKYQEFPSKFFCLTVPKIFVGESFSVLLLSGIKNVWIRVGGGSLGVSRFYVEFFFVLQCGKFSQGTLLCCASEFSGSEKVFVKEGWWWWGVTRFSVEVFLSHSADIFGQGILQCFKIFEYRKMLGIREGGGYHDFPSTVFCLTVLKLS